MPLKLNGMKIQPLFFYLAILLLVVARVTKADDKGIAPLPEINDTPVEKLFKGTFTNGMKGDSIFFNVSPDNKKLTNLTFKGYWRCNGKLEQVSTGPDGSFDIEKGIAKGHISEHPNGGSTAWRFDIDAAINGDEALGTFRMNINNLGCDSYLLKFTAVAE